MRSGLDADEEASLKAACAAATRYRSAVPDMPVPARYGPAEAERRFRGPLSTKGETGERVIQDMVDMASDGLCQMSSPNFYGFVLGGSHPVGVAADMLVAAWGQNCGSATMTPAIGAMHRAVCDWVLDLLELPRDSGAGIVTGATMANAVGIMAARNALLKRAGWDVEDRGLFDAPKIEVLIGDDAHSAPFAALRYAGMGAGRVHRVETDSEGRIKAQAYHKALEDCRGPILAILQAGQINTGAFDPFEAIIPATHEKGGWVHVDGAFGLWLAAVPELADRLAGVQLADSWAVDLHKWLNAPFDAGMVICRDRAPLVASMSARGAYLPEETEYWDIHDSTPELSQRARGVSSYAILRYLGKDGVRELVRRHCALARHYADLVSAEPGIRVLNEVACNQVAVRCGEGELAERQTLEVLRRVQQRGRVFPSHGVWQDGAIIRASIINYATRQEDIELLAREIIDAWREVRDA